MARLKPLLDENTKRLRLQWAWDHVGWTDAMWDQILWSDKTWRNLANTHGFGLLEKKGRKRFIILIALN